MHASAAKVSKDPSQLALALSGCSDGLGLVLPGLGQQARVTIALHLRDNCLKVARLDHGCHVLGGQLVRRVLHCRCVWACQLDASRSMYRRRCRCKGLVPLPFSQARGGGPHWALWVATRTRVASDPEAKTGRGVSGADTG